MTKSKGGNDRGVVVAEPTKNFFVTMLTRDIALIDAIMDLIDNCIDGIHRSLAISGKKKLPTPYSGYFAKLTIDENSFQIEDNCGGIPLEISKKYAFRMGRDLENQNDEKLETVGMYGIGMKRAIFKMGQEAKVFTWHNTDQYRVYIPKEWVSTQEWTFEYELMSKSEISREIREQGTKLIISELWENISNQFTDTGGFLSDLAVALKNHYGYIIGKGFKLYLNGAEIDPIERKLLTTEDTDIETGIKPYIYTGKISDVDVSIAIGFYREPPTQDEIENELEGKLADRNSENAGITVLCNERVVLYCDKTFMTGWGEPPVPKYHTQFVAIAGVVHFRSKNAYSLPVTTTKRGLDTSSPVYAETRIKIKEGLKLFTQFTNNWKTKSKERDEVFKSTKTIAVLEPIQSSSKNFDLKRASRGKEGMYQIPQLPKPEAALERNNVTISFSKEKIKVQAIANYFLSGKNANAATVGSFCFDEMYSRVENDL